MTREEAIKLLDPETTAEAIAEIEYYHGFRGREAAIAAITDACSIAVKALREKTIVHAHWFLLDDCANEGVYCSACTKKVYKTDYANQKLKSKYCPNCGATMDESISCGHENDKKGE